MVKLISAHNSMQVKVEGKSAANDMLLVFILACSEQALKVCSFKSASDFTFSSAAYHTKRPEQPQTERSSHFFLGSYPVLVSACGANYLLRIDQATAVITVYVIIVIIW